MKSHDHYIDMIHDAVSAIEYPKQPEGLYAPIAYTLESGGKRLRPTLVLATADACGADPRRAINQALAIEMFHNFTLLHDDVMDRADVRRGRPTVHRRWNDNTAILSGDAMLTMATILLSRDAGNQLHDLLDLFNTTAMEVYEGQQMDMDFEDRTDVTVEEYLEMIRLKTSVLLGAACKCGAIVAGASAETANAFYDYGLYLGLAFQLRDDWLDTFGDPAIFGKAIGGDILNDKKTWLLITALNEDLTGRAHRLIGDNEEPDKKLEEMKAIYQSLNLDKRCDDLINGYISQAIQALELTGINTADRLFFTRLAQQSALRSN